MQHAAIHFLKQKHASAATRCSLVGRKIKITSEIQISNADKLGYVP